MRKKKMLALLLATLFILTAFVGCGASIQETGGSKYYAEEDAVMDMMVEEPMAMVETEEMEYSTSSGQTGGGEMTVEEVKTYAEKIIYSGTSYMETTEFDEALASLDQAVRQFGGFVQDSSVDGNTRRNEDGTTVVVNRWAYYIVRIPTDRFEEFMTLTEGIGNVIRSSRNAENVTSQYTDYEARLESLNTQEERLMEMLRQSGDLESLIQLEARLSEVRYEIESIERNLRNLDQRLAYSTVTLEVQEVEVYTPTATVQRTYGQKMADAFRDGWQNFARGFQNFTVWLVYALPTLILLAALATGFVLGGRRIRKSRRAKKQTEKTEE